MLGILSTNPIDDFGKPYPLWEDIVIILLFTVWVALYVGEHETIRSQPYFLTVVAAVGVVQHVIRLGRGVTLRTNDSKR